MCNSDLYMDPLEKYLYEEPEDVGSEDHNGNLQGIEEEEMNENYEPMEKRDYGLICIFVKRK